MISRGVQRVARTKLRVLIFLIGGKGRYCVPAKARVHSTADFVLCQNIRVPGTPAQEFDSAGRRALRGDVPTGDCSPKEQIGARRKVSPARLLLSSIPLAMTAAPTFSLHPDRFFDAEPSVRRAARALYEEMRALPLVCPHGHVDPSLLAEDRAFPEPAALLITPDHYLFRMLFSQGVSLESLGVPTRDPRAADRARSAEGLAALRRELPSVPRHPVARVARLRAARAVRRPRAARRRVRRPHLRSDRRTAEVARVPASRTIRQLQHRSARDDGRGQRRPAPSSGDPRRRVGTAEWCRRSAPTRCSARQADLARRARRAGEGDGAPIRASRRSATRSSRAAWRSGPSAPRPRITPSRSRTPSGSRRRRRGAVRQGAAAVTPTARIRRASRRTC